MATTLYKRNAGCTAKIKHFCLQFTNIKSLQKSRKIQSQVALITENIKTMDTDDLSTEAYQGIIIEAEKFNHDLTLQFGVLASSCKDEDEYLDNTSDLICELRSMGDEELGDVFFGNPPDTKSLNLTLDRISENIEKVRKIPKKKRHYDF